MENRPSAHTKYVQHINELWVELYKDVGLRLNFVQLHVIRCGTYETKLNKCYLIA